MIKAVSTQRKRKKTLKTEKKPALSFSHNDNTTELTLPCQTVSEANNFDSFWVKNERHQQQKKTVHYAFKLAFLAKRPKLPCVVTMTRFASRFLDEEDNLRMAFKWIKDQIASELTQDFVPGRADSDKRIKWEYAQQKSKKNYARITISYQ